MASLHSLVNYGADSDNEDEQEDRNKDSLVEYRDEDSAFKAAEPTVVSDSATDLHANGKAAFYVSESDDDSAKGKLVNTDQDEIDRIQLPPEPDGIHSLNVQKKIITMLARKMDSNMNKILEKRKNFRNPSIYEKLVEFCAIDETGTNYPAEMYNPKLWDKHDYYNAIAKVQKETYEKKEKAKQSRTQIDFVKVVKRNASSTTNSASGDDANRKRKSKWDIPSATSNQTDSAVTNQALDSSSNAKKSRNS
ncbi:SAP30-binding protein [Trichoplax sp. H2]|nr:SAP30-binding protein [Trichoplax sp. H2]|eukprot:RDD37378.1 SAP30-binding protein [Trichoplax sp. H2]